jgi:hypothetical protein
MSTLVDATGQVLISTEGGELTRYAQQQLARTPANFAEGGTEPWYTRAQRLGREGLKGAGIEQNTMQIDSFTHTANFRVPDGLTDSLISEVKNVGKLGFTNQINDYLLYAQSKNLIFELWTRQGTEIAPTLQELFDNGSIIHKLLPW